MDKKIAKQIETLREKEIAETLSYTKELQLRPKRDNTDLKAMLFKILIVLIITGAALALIFGIGAAKAVI